MQKNVKAALQHTKYKKSEYTIHSILLLEMIHQPSDNIIPRSRNRLQRAQHTPQTHRTRLHHRLLQHDHHRLEPPQHVRRPVPQRLVRLGRADPEIRPCCQTFRVLRGGTTPVFDEYGWGGPYAFPEIDERVVGCEEPHAFFHAHRGREDGSRRRRRCRGVAVNVKRQLLKVDEFFVVRHSLNFA